MTGEGASGAPSPQGRRFAFLRAAADALFKFPPYPHDGGARSGRTIASGHRFAFLRAAADAAIADYVCSRCSVARSCAKFGMRHVRNVLSAE